MGRGVDGKRSTKGVRYSVQIRTAKGSRRLGPGIDATNNYLFFITPCPCESWLNCCPATAQDKCCAGWFMMDMKQHPHIHRMGSTIPTLNVAPHVTMSMEPARAAGLGSRLEVSRIAFRPPASWSPRGTSAWPRIQPWSTAFPFPVFQRESQSPPPAHRVLSLFRRHHGQRNAVHAWFLFLTCHPPPPPHPRTLFLLHTPDRTPARGLPTRCPVPQPQPQDQHGLPQRGPGGRR